MKASYSNLDSDLKTSIFNVVEQTMGEVVRPGRSPSVSETQMRSLVQTKSVADIIVQEVLFNNRFIFPIAETPGMLVDRGVGECHLRDIDEASKTTAGPICLNIYRCLVRQDRRRCRLIPSRKKKTFVAVVAAVARLATTVVINRHQEGDI